MRVREQWIKKDDLVTLQTIDLPDWGLGVVLEIIEQENGTYVKVLWLELVNGTYVKGSPGLGIYICTHLRPLENIAELRSLDGPD